MPPVRKTIAADGIATIRPSWDSHKLAIFSICASLIFALICLTQITQIINGAVIFIVGLLVLKEAGKKRQGENEADYQNRTADANAGDYTQSNDDLHFAVVAMLVSGALFFFTINLWPIGLALIAAIFISFSLAIGNSMLPELGYGDLLLVERFLLFRRQIKRGDIIGFPKPLGLKIDFPPLLLKRRGLLGPMLLKRVVALPNETVRVTQGRLFINDVPLVEDRYMVDSAAYEINVLGDLGKEGFKPYSKPEHADKPITVPKDHYFVLGDFRIEGNIDSHVFGFVPAKLIQYRLLAILPIGLLGLRIKRQNIFKVTRHLQVAKKLLQEHKLEETISECNNAIAIYDKCAPAFTYRANARLNLNQEQVAVNDCNLAIKYYKTTRDPAPGAWENASLPYSIRSLAFMRLKKWKEALRDCNTVIALSKNNSTSYVNRAELYREMGKFSEARKDCDRALAITPSTSAAFKLRALINIQTKGWEQALIDSDKAIALNANDALAHVNRATALLWLGQLEAAIESCNKAENVDRNQGEVYFVRAGANLALKKYEQAYGDCERAKELGLFTDHYCNLLGAVCIFLEKWAEALDNLNKAVNTGVNEAKIFNNRAVAHFELGHYDESLSDCQAAIKIDASLAPAYKNRARIRMKRNNNQDAVTDLNRAIELDSSRGDFYYYRSQAYLALGNSELADSDLAKSRELNYKK